MSGEDVYGMDGQDLADLALGYAGLSYRPETRYKYVDLLFHGEDPERADEMARTSSSCGLFIRALWRMAGLKDARLEPPYHVGSVMQDLVNMAKELAASGEIVLADGKDDELVY